MLARPGDDPAPCPHARAPLPATAVLAPPPPSLYLPPGFFDQRHCFLPRRSCFPRRSTPRRRVRAPPPLLAQCNPSAIALAPHLLDVPRDTAGDPQRQFVRTREVANKPRVRQACGQPAPGRPAASGGATRCTRRSERVVLERREGSLRRAGRAGARACGRVTGGCVADDFWREGQGGRASGGGEIAVCGMTDEGAGLGGG